VTCRASATPGSTALPAEFGELKPTDQAEASRRWSTIDRRVIDQVPRIPLLDWPPRR